MIWWHLMWEFASNSFVGVGQVKSLLTMEGFFAWLWEEVCFFRLYIYMYAFYCTRY